MVSGTVSFQANDKTDVFYVAHVSENGIEPSDETIFNVEDSQFESDKAWVTGHVPKMHAVDVGGDTTTINAWFKAETFAKAFVLRVYVECELAEEFEEVIADEKVEKVGSKIHFLEPQEIHL